MLLAWPVLSYLFVSRRDPAKALTLIVVGGYLFLPVKTAIDPPFIPPIDKNTIITLSAFLALGIRKPRSFRWLPQNRLFKTLYILYFISPIFTVLANGDPFIDGAAYVQGLTLYDVLGVLVSQATDVVLISLGMNYLQDSAARLTFLKWIVILGLIYSPLILVEVRLSPQLHNWIYGFFPSSFAQQVRSGGFRPVVFLGHGLATSFFVFNAIAAAVTLWRSKTRFGNISLSVWIAYLCIVLFFCKSLSSIIYCLTFLSASLLLHKHRWLQLAVVLVSITISFPILRTFELVPTVALVNIAESINPERAQSLSFRFDNEDILLEKANQRPAFGWGLWGRNRVYSPVTGQDISVTDGAWIITLGRFGLVGFIAQFGLLFIPLLLFSLKNQKNNKYLSTDIAACSLLLSINSINLVPNSSITPIALIICGIFMYQHWKINIEMNTYNSQ